MTKIKICGLTREEDIESVNRYRPEYAGFVFYPASHRYVTVERALQLRKRLNESIEPVAVFLDATEEEIAAPVVAGVARIVQLHGRLTNCDIDRIRQMLPEGTQIIQALKVRSAEDIAAANASAADRILLDNGLGGTGESFDWSLLSGIRRDFFLAGGLKPENVREAIMVARAAVNAQDAAVRDAESNRAAIPWAVDVSSGVETGKQKDEAKIRAFCEQVRACR